MSKKAKIILFIVVACVLLLIPFAVNAGHKADAVEVSLDTPEINAMTTLTGCASIICSF